MLRYDVVRRNLRRGTERVIASHFDLDRAEERAIRGNEMHRATKMFHYVDRVFAAEVA